MYQGIEQATYWLLKEAYDKQFFVDLELFPLSDTEGNFSTSQTQSISGYPIALYDTGLILLSFLISSTPSGKTISYFKKNVAYYEIYRITSPFHLTEEHQKSVSEYLSACSKLLQIDNNGEVLTPRELFDYQTQIDLKQPVLTAHIPNRALEKLKEIPKKKK